MKTHLLFSALCLSCGVVLGATPPKEPVFTRDELKKHFALEQKLNPKKGDIYEKLVEMYPGQRTFTRSEVQAAIDPTIKIERSYKAKPTGRTTDVPIDAFSAAEVKTRFDLLARHDQANEGLMKDLVDKYGTQPWYTAAELRDVETNRAKPAKVSDFPLPPDPVALARLKAETRKRSLLEDFETPRLRKDWRDVLYDEDPSQRLNEDKKLGDLVGATFSFAWNGKAKSETWTAVGALIMPWAHRFKLSGGLVPAQLAFAPSVSINRLSTNGDPAKESDSVLYRAGGYAEWNFRTPQPTGIQLRAAAVSVSDTSNEAGLSGYEVELEPRWQNPFFPLGYKKILIDKEPLKEDRSDISVLEYQLRAWARLEGGDVQDIGDAWLPSTDSFLRIGPAIQLQINAPRLVFGRDASLTAFYSYMAVTDGPRERDSFFRVTGVLNLIKDEASHRKVSLNIDYQNGGLEFTKEEVETLVIGIGILF